MKETAIEFVEHFFHSPSDFSRKGGLWLIRSGATRAKPSYRVGPRMIAYYSVHFVVEGAVEFAFGNRAVRLGQGDLFCQFPQRTYEYRRCTSERDLQMFWHAFDGPQTDELLAAIGLRPDHPYAVGLLGSESENTLRQMHDLMRLQPDAELLQLSLLYKLLAGLQHRRSQSVVGEGWLDECVRYLQLHYTEPIHIGQVARHLGLNRSYLSSAFSRRMGRSPVQYLQSLRLDKGAELLRETSHSVTEIALSVGYPDLYSFSRAFMRNYGMPPSQYRGQN